MPTSPLPAHHRPGGGFRNPWPGQPARGFGSALRWMWQRARAGKLGKPPIGTPPRVVPHAPLDAHAPADECRITWIGHSSFLLQVAGLNVLTDPVFSERASPRQWIGPRRLVAPGLAIDALPPIDVVLQSHNHYDHLDDASVRQIAARFPDAVWCAPLGVAMQLESRGVRKLVERDWFENAAPCPGVRVTCVPARHFSGRGLTDRDATLWCGWTLEAGSRRIYFVGDSAYSPAFAEVGQRCGPFDAVLMPIGAYDPRWFMSAVHADPDEAVSAFVDLQTAHPSHPSVFIGMHWGTFALTDEPVDEPPRLAHDGWAERNLPADRLWIMSPGETRSLGA